MTETKPGNTGTEKKSRLPLVLALIFVGVVTIVFLTHRENSINWIEDYQAGVKLAKQQNKPILLAFYKSQTSFCTLMTENTYSNPEVIKYIEDNFIPVFIDVDKQPKLAKQYNIGYYPTHYVKYPDSNKLVGPQMGYDMPAQFIKILRDYLKKAQPGIK